MPDDKEERIRRRAHEIWEQEGKPEGHHHLHWDRAALEVAEEQSELLQPDADELITPGLQPDQSPGSVEIVARKTVKTSRPKT